MNKAERVFIEELKLKVRLLEAKVAALDKRICDLEGGMDHLHVDPITGTVHELEPGA
ncbi:MAG TPA: hypothetical protein VF748_14655 [Candidatus Acidoferrum sp.]